MSSTFATSRAVSASLLYNRESILDLRCEVGAITSTVKLPVLCHVDTSSNSEFTADPTSDQHTGPLYLRHLVTARPLIHAPAFPNGTVSGRLAQALTFQTLCPSRLCTQVQFQDVRVFVLRPFGR